MVHLRPRRGRVLAVPVGLALTASLGLLPGVIASAAPAAAQSAPAAASAGQDGPVLSYVVNTAPDARTVGSVKRAIAQAGGTVVVTHAKIGVIVVHSANPDFAKTIRTVQGVQSAGATRTAPLKAVATTDIGKPEKVSEPRSVAALKAARSAGKEPLESLQWDIPAIKADQAAQVDPGSRDVTVAVIDTGVDDTHPDLAPNFSARQSANCVGGVSDATRGAWRPYNPAGTTTARTSPAPSPPHATAPVSPGWPRA
jgi:hypothetical protein